MKICVILNILNDTEADMAITNEEDARIDDLEKLNGIFTGIAEELDDLTDSLGTSEEALDKLDAGKTDKEIAELIAAPLVNALDGISAILNGANKEIMEMNVEQGIMNNCDSNLTAELKLYIKEHHKPVSFPNQFPGKVQEGQQGIAEKAQSVRIRSVGDAADSISGFIKEERDFTSFAHSLDKIREEEGMSPAELYKAAWIDKRLYSKIMAASKYRPAKNTAISFGLALKLKLDEFASFLQNAGFALSNSSVFDLVIRFCVEREIYDLHEVNTLLLQADQKTLAKEAA